MGSCDDRMNLGTLGAIISDGLGKSDNGFAGIKTSGRTSKAVNACASILATLPSSFPSAGYSYIVTPLSEIPSPKIGPDLILYQVTSTLASRKASKILMPK